MWSLHMVIMCTILEGAGKQSYNHTRDQIQITELSNADVDIRVSCNYFVQSSFELRIQTLKSILGQYKANSATVKCMV